MSEPTLHTPKNILYIAKDFFESGFTAAQKLPKENQTAEIFPQLSFPATCLSFSLELSLKALHLHLGEKRGGHDLDDLFYKLPEDLQNKIYEFSKTHDKCKDTISIILKKGDYSKLKGGTKRDPYKSVQEEVKKVLYSHKKAFIDFRYVFEVAEKISEDQEWEFSFRSLGNLAYSTLMVTAKELGITLDRL